MKLSLSFIEPTAKPPVNSSGTDRAKTYASKCAQLKKCIEIINRTKLVYALLGPTEEDIL